MHQGLVQEPEQGWLAAKTAGKRLRARASAFIVHYKGPGSQNAGGGLDMTKGSSKTRSGALIYRGQSSRPRMKLPGRNFPAFYCQQWAPLI